MESNYEFKILLLKIAHVIISMTSEIEDFDFDNVLIDEMKNHRKMFWFLTFHRNL